MLANLDLETFCKLLHVGLKPFQAKFRDVGFDLLRAFVGEVAGALWAVLDGYAKA